MVKFKILHGTKNALPVQKIEGQLYVTDDTAEIYYDFDGVNRYNLGSVYVVNELPATPIPYKIYLVKPDKLWVYDTAWKCLNNIGDVKSVYQYAQDCGYVGTEDEFKGVFLNNLQYQWGVSQVNGKDCVTLTYNEE